MDSAYSSTHLDPLDTISFTESRANYQNLFTASSRSEISAGFISKDVHRQYRVIKNDNSTQIIRTTQKPLLKSGDDEEKRNRASKISVISTLIFIASAIAAFSTHATLILALLFTQLAIASSVVGIISAVYGLKSETGKKRSKVALTLLSIAMIILLIVINDLTSRPT